MANGRFRYPLQIALDDASAQEARAQIAVAKAMAARDAERRARAELALAAVAARSELNAERSAPGAIYIEVGRRLEAIAAADRERRAREAAAERRLTGEREALAARSARRTALERHRDLARLRFEAERDRREAAACDEANAARSAFVREARWS
jgi:hypothetical protein